MISQNVKFLIPNQNVDQKLKTPAPIRFMKCSLGVKLGILPGKGGSYNTFTCMCFIISYNV